MARFEERVKEVEKLLEKDIIDIEALRAFAHAGIPDRPGLRALIWKLLLGYLPPERAKWDSVLSAQRATYKEFLSTLVISSHDLADQNEEEEVDCDPLGVVASPTKGNSKWDTFFKENEILQQIDIDVRRLTPEFSFYQTPTGRPRPIASALQLRVQREVAESSTLRVTRDGVMATERRSASTSIPLVLGPMEECHWEGMNEILGPLYYVMASNSDVEWQRHCEADSFFCFMALMGNIRHVFDRSVDSSELGIAGILQRLEELLEEYTPRVHNALNDMNITMYYFAFRWITLLLSQEFRLPDVIRLWDTLFSSRNLVDCILYICASMLQLVLDTLEERNFSISLKLLQHYPATIDVLNIIAGSDHIADMELWLLV
eukprot:gene3765-6288_t